MAWLFRLAAKSNPKEEVNSALRAALLALLAGEEQRAEGLINRALEADPGALDPALALGRLCRVRGRADRAIRIHEKLLLRNDLDEASRIMALLELGRGLEQTGSMRRAIACYEEVLIRDGNNLEALEALAGLLAAVRDYGRAIAISRRLARRKREKSAPTEARLQTGMAEVAHGEGRHQVARKLVKRALRRDRRNSQALLLLGRLESERGRSRAALSAWKKAAEVGGNGAHAAYPLLETAFAALDRAREYPGFLRRLRERRPDDARLGLRLARALSERGDVEAAVAELRRLLDRDSGSLEPRVALGRLLLAEHRNTDALKEYGELLEVLSQGGDRNVSENPP